MAIRTYTASTLHPDLTEATFTLYVTSDVKYEVNNLEENSRKVEFTGVKAFSIIEGGAEAEEIERDTDASGVDEYHEYLRLDFEDGGTATYRNSHVVMFML